MPRRPVDGWKQPQDGPPPPRGGDLDTRSTHAQAGAHSALRKSVSCWVVGGWETQRQSRQRPPCLPAGSQPLGVRKGTGVEQTELSSEVGTSLAPAQLVPTPQDLEAGAGEAQVRLEVKDGGGTNGDFQTRPGDSYTPPVVGKVEIFIIIGGWGRER